MADLGDFTSLAFDEVKRFVAALPDAAIAELVKGPLPDLSVGDKGYGEEEDCRVCLALDALRADGGPADALLDWHDFVSKSFDMVRLIAQSKSVSDGRERQLTEECQAMIGGLSYARCTTIYALAELEFSQRELGLTVG